MHIHVRSKAETQRSATEHRGIYRDVTSYGKFVCDFERWSDPDSGHEASSINSFERIVAMKQAASSRIDFERTVATKQVRAVIRVHSGYEASSRVISSAESPRNKLEQ